MDQPDFETLAAFRNSLRRFLKFSEASAEAAGVSSQSYQALLAIKGLDGGRKMTIGELAQVLLIRHNSAVGLADRLVAQGYLKRQLDPHDRRRVFLLLTPSGESLVTSIATRNLAKLIELRGDLESVLKSLRSFGE